MSGFNRQRLTGVHIVVLTPPVLGSTPLTNINTTPPPHLCTLPEAHFVRNQEPSAPAHPRQHPLLLVRQQGGPQSIRNV